jgi:hypothetical protein
VDAAAFAMIDSLLTDPAKAGGAIIGFAHGAPPQNSFPDLLNFLSCMSLNVLNVEISFVR